MFDRITKKITDKVGKSVQETVKETAAPLQDKLKTVAGNKIDLYSRVIRFGLLLVLFVEGTRRVTNESNRMTDSPNHIVINNYLGKEPDERKVRR